MSLVELLIVARMPQPVASEAVALESLVGLELLRPIDKGANVGPLGTNEPTTRGGPSTVRR